MADDLLEKKSTGEFKPCGSDDVLTTALETPEHGGRVRGVSCYLTPIMYFNLPHGKRSRITKAELLARDRQRDADLEKTKKEMAAQIAELKAMHVSKNQSPVSDKASCERKQRQETKLSKPSAAAKDLLPQMVDDDECVAVNPPPEKKGPRQCDLSLNNIENKVAFGMLFDEEDMNISVHAMPL